MGFWFFMCLSTVGHIRVATLCNHLKQNNDFTKCFLPENHIPEWQRLTPVKRLLRLIIYLALLLCVACYVCNEGLNELEGRALRKRECHKNCERVHFPSLTCREVTDLVISKEGNAYEKLFKYHYPANFTSTIAGEKELRLREYQQCLYYAMYPEEEGMQPMAYVSQNPDRRENSDACFTSCARSREKVSEHRDDRRNTPKCPKAKSQAEYDAQFDGYLGPGKQQKLGLSEWFKCTVPADPDSAENECDIFYRNGLWCASENTAYDNIVFPGQMCFGGTDKYPTPSSELPKWCISAWQIFITIFICNIIHLFISMFILGAANIIEETDFASSAKKFGCELTITMIFFTILIMLLGPLLKAIRLKKTESIVVTWMCALIIDQAKSFLVQPIIWWIVIRRCGNVEPGIQEYNEEYLMQWDLQESLMTAIRRKTQATLQWRPVAIFITHVLMGAYAIFVMLQLAFNVPAPPKQNPSPLVVDVCKYIDLAFIILFILEVSVMTFAFGPKYLAVPWNLFDAFIIAGTLLWWIYITNETGRKTGLGLLRVVRLIRMMMVVRRVSEGRKKLKRIKKSTTGYDVGSHVDTVLELVDELQLQGNVAQYLKEDLEWFTEIIVGNKLYKVSLAENNAETGKQVSAWITDASTHEAPVIKSVKASAVSASITGRQGMNRPGGNAGGSHVRATSVRSSSVIRRRASEVGGRGQGDEATQLNLQLYSRSNLSQGEEGQIELTLKAMDEWSFDLLMMAEVLDVNLIPLVFLKFVILYEFVPTLNVDFDLLFNYCTRIQENSKSQVKFHSPAHMANMIQASHFFLMHGLDTHLTFVEKFTLLFACLVAYDTHPGLTNDFLVNARHPRAIRYNDRGVLQNHNLSQTFVMLQDPELNFFVHVDKEKYDNFRKLLISIILKLEFRKHFDELSVFKTKLASDFPLADSEEDKQVLMAISLRMADLSWSCRPLQSYLRWSEKGYCQYVQVPARLLNGDRPAASLKLCRFPQ
eukprot:GEMP01003165.1.p1 GENE.GEMP01003165.1~~GEMP01003165.1.p1  ORF type:complete len:1002 (+),score=149.85 GEMP01003165.1:39-3008(+)